jgi:lipopolysaccharide transport system permease protein
MVQLNPITPLLVTVRELATAQVLSRLPAFLAITGFSVIGTVIGLIVFRVSMPYVAERVYG